MKAIEKAIEVAKSKRISQGELARMLGVPPSRMSEWKSDQGSPSVAVIVRIAQALEVSLDWLLDDEADMPPNARGNSESLTETERIIIDIIRALGLSKEEAIRRIASPVSLSQSKRNEIIPSEHVSLSDRLNSLIKQNDAALIPAKELDSAGPEAVQTLTIIRSNQVIEETSLGLHNKALISVQAGTIVTFGVLSFACIDTNVPSAHKKNQEIKAVVKKGQTSRVTVANRMLLNGEFDIYFPDDTKARQAFDSVNRPFARAFDYVIGPLFKAFSDVVVEDSSGRGFKLPADHVYLVLIHEGR